MISRRNAGSASLNVLELIHDKDRWKTVGQDAFFLLTTVNHISVCEDLAIDFVQKRTPSKAGVIFETIKGVLLAQRPLVPLFFTEAVYGFDL